MTSTVRVMASGAIILDGVLSCDGFCCDVPIRAQTHVHTDHMTGFESSKGCQSVVTTLATHALLCAKFNADLPYRSNLIRLEFGERFETDTHAVSLHSSEHMLGSAQIRVEGESGHSVGYSGDFAWPMDDAMRVDTLVVDATYGSPRSVREYSQGDAENALLMMTRELLNDGPVHIVTHQGTLQRAMEVLCGNQDVPLVASAELIRELDVYREFGFPIAEVVDVRSEEGRSRVREGRCIRFFGPRDAHPIGDGRASTLKLSAFMAKPDDPIVSYSARAYGIAMSNHADFEGTIAYIEATGARRVLIDNSRGGHAYELAEAVETRLSVRAEVPEVEVSREWGRG